MQIVIRNVATQNADPVLISLDGCKGHSTVLGTCLGKVSAGQHAVKVIDKGVLALLGVAVAVQSAALVKYAGQIQKRGIAVDTAHMHGHGNKAVIRILVILGNKIVARLKDLQIGMLQPIEIVKHLIRGVLVDIPQIAIRIKRARIFLVIRGHGGIPRAVTVLDTDPAAQIQICRILRFDKEELRAVKLHVLKLGGMRLEVVLIQLVFQLVQTLVVAHQRGGHVSACVRDLLVQELDDHVLFDAQRRDDDDQQAHRQHHGSGKAAHGALGTVGLALVLACGAHLLAYFLFMQLLLLLLQL